MLTANVSSTRLCQPRIMPATFLCPTSSRSRNHRRPHSLTHASLISHWRKGLLFRDSSLGTGTSPASKGSHNTKKGNESGYPANDPGLGYPQRFLYLPPLVAERPRGSSDVRPQVGPPRVELQLPNPKRFVFSLVRLLLPLLPQPFMKPLA
jgi:hypothetical protein